MTDAATPAPFDIDAYINKLNRKENKDAARNALNAMADAGTRGLEAYGRSETDLASQRAEALGGVGQGFDNVPEALRAQLQATVGAPITSALASTASAKATFAQDLARQQAMSTNYFSQLDASPAFPVLGGGGGGGGGGWGGGGGRGGGGSRPYSKTESQAIALQNAQQAMKSARARATQAATNAARAQVATSNKARAPQTARRTQAQMSNDSEAYRKAVQVRTTLEGNQQRAQRNANASTGRAREQAQAAARAAQEAYQRALGFERRATANYQRTQQEYAKAAPYLDPKSLQTQEANEMNRFGSIAADVNRQQTSDAFFYGAAPGEIGYARTEFGLDPRGRPVAVNTALDRSMPPVEYLSPSVREDLLAQRAGLYAMQIGAQAEMAALGWDPALITEDEVLAYMNKSGLDSRQENEILLERDYMGRTGGIYPSADDQFDAADARREAEIRGVTGGYSSYDDYLDAMAEQRAFEGVASGRYIYKGVPYESEEVMVEAINDDRYQQRLSRDLDEDLGDFERADILGQAGYQIDRPELRELAGELDTSTQNATELLNEPVYASMQQAAINRFNSENGSARDPDDFDEWTRLSPQEMFENDPEWAQMAAELDASPYQNTWRSALRKQVLGQG